MTISAKLSDVGGLEYIVSDPADTDDVNGFSDSQDAVGGESAKFSDLSAMKANAGRIIGISQVQFNTALAILDRTVESEVNVTDSANAIDDTNAFASLDDRTVSEMVVDFGSSLTKVVKVEYASGSNASVTCTVEKSANPTGPWTEIASANKTGTATAVVDGGSHTFRYIRVWYEAGSSDITPLRLHNVWAEPSTPDSVDVELLSTSALDSPTGTVLIAQHTIFAPTRENQTPVTSIFNSVLYMTGNAEYVTLRVVSYNGDFNVPVTLSDITTVKEAL